MRMPLPGRAEAPGNGASTTDGLGRLIEVQRPDYDWDGAGGGHEVVWTQYDGVGQKVAESVPYQKSP